MPTSAPSSELRKLRILQEMGITLYLPRYRLPGAAPSRVQPWPWLSPREVTAPSESLASVVDAAAREEAHSAPPRRVEVNAESRRPRVPQIEIEVSQAPASTPTEKPVTKPAALAAANEAEVRFQALLFPVAPQLAVLAFVPALAQPQLQERERNLLYNILRWLGVSEPQLRSPRPFLWPIPNLPGGGLTLAGASLRAFLDQAQREEKFARVLVFGGLLNDALEAAGGGAPGELHPTYSLQEMTAVPALKRECWLSLIPLQRWLAQARRQ